MIFSGYTALHYSVLLSRHSTIKWLLKSGARTNVRSLFGVTPMTLAVLCDDAHSVKILIDHGYPIHRSYPWNEFPIEQAIRVHSEGSAMMIAYLGCELKVKPTNRPTNPITMAANEGLVNLMYLIVYMNPSSINQTWIRRRQYPYALYRLKKVQDDLQRMFSNPFRLKDLCRAKISQTIGKFYTEKVVELKKEFRHFNDSHIEFLRYSELVDPVKHFRPVGKRLNYFEVGGVEFYWDQRTLRYRQPSDEDQPVEKKKVPLEMKSKNAATRIRSTLIRRNELQQQRKLINANFRLRNSQSFSRNTKKSYLNTSRGFLPRGE